MLCVDIQNRGRVVRGVVEVKDRGNKIWYSTVVTADVQRSPPESMVL